MSKLFLHNRFFFLVASQLLTFIWLGTSSSFYLWPVRKRYRIVYLVVYHSPPKVTFIVLWTRRTTGVPCRVILLLCSRIFQSIFGCSEEQIIELLKEFFPDFFSLSMTQWEIGCCVLSEFSYVQIQKKNSSNLPKSTTY